MDTYKKEITIYTLKYRENYEDGNSVFKVEKFRTLQEILKRREEISLRRAVVKSTILLIKGKAPTINRDPQQEIY